MATEAAEAASEPTQRDASPSHNDDDEDYPTGNTEEHTYICEFSF